MKCRAVQGSGVAAVAAALEHSEAVTATNLPGQFTGGWGYNQGNTLDYHNTIITHILLLHILYFSTTGN